MSAEIINIELVYAHESQQTLMALTVPAGTTLLEAVKRSGLLERFPEIKAAELKLGVFSKLEKSPESRVLQAGDRVEIYRPLLLDPKEARKLRAEKAKNKRSV
jgi:putative ubiquitin-RnfH superfamily antitoxin RatB of RatAB toxin-antitoxin module